MVANLYGTTFPRGGGQRSVYKLPLMDYNTKPFKSDIYDKLFEAGSEEEKAADANSGKKDGKKGADAKDAGKAPKAEAAALRPYPKCRQPYAGSRPGYMPNAETGHRSRRRP